MRVAPQGPLQSPSSPLHPVFTLRALVPPMGPRCLFPQRSPEGLPSYNQDSSVLPPHLHGVGAWAPCHLWEQEPFEFCFLRRKRCIWSLETGWQGGLF